MPELVFEQQDFAQGATIALSKLTELMSIHAEEWFSQPIIAFIDELCQRQSRDALEPVSCISGSLLRTSLLHGVPGYRLDAYGQDWFLYERPLATAFVPCPWLSPFWTELVAHFQGILDRREIQKYCFPLQAEQAAWQCTGPLFSLIGALLKYLTAPVKDAQELKKLVKGNDFKIEFGEFLDWKLILIAEYPEIDIFNSRGRQFRHHQFSGKTFDKKRFYKFDLKGSTFRNCIFSDSEILETVLNDCVFEHCRFKNVAFTDALLAGAQFQDCTLEYVDFENVIASFAGLPTEKVDDWYRAMYMVRTSANHVCFSDCDLREGKMEQCTTVYTTLKNSLVESSDFSILTVDD